MATSATLVEVEDTLDCHPSSRRAQRYAAATAVRAAGERGAAATQRAAAAAKAHDVVRALLGIDDKGSATPSAASPSAPHRALPSPGAVDPGARALLEAYAVLCPDGSAGASPAEGTRSASFSARRTRSAAAGEGVAVADKGRAVETSSTPTSSPRGAMTMADAQAKARRAIRALDAAVAESTVAIAPTPAVPRPAPSAQPARFALPTRSAGAARSATARTRRLEEALRAAHEESAAARERARRVQTELDAVLATHARASSSPTALRLSERRNSTTHIDAYRAHNKTQAALARLLVARRCASAVARRLDALAHGAEDGTAASLAAIAALRAVAHAAVDRGCDAAERATVAAREATQAQRESEAAAARALLARTAGLRSTWCSALSEVDAAAAGAAASAAACPHLGAEPAAPTAAVANAASAAAAEAERLSAAVERLEGNDERTRIAQSVINVRAVAMNSIMEQLSAVGDCSIDEKGEAGRGGE
jgi:hypothetical protein